MVVKQMITEVQRKIIKTRVNNYKAYDRKRFGTNENSISYEQYLELWIEQEGKCYWTGLKMTMADGLPTDASLDRIHCDRPHTADNTVLVHRSMNLGRNNSSLLDWVRYLHSCGILAEEHTRDLVANGFLVDDWE